MLSEISQTQKMQLYHTFFPHERINTIRDRKKTSVREGLNKHG